MHVPRRSARAARAPRAALTARAALASLLGGVLVTLSSTASVTATPVPLATEDIRLIRAVSTGGEQLLIEREDGWWISDVDAGTARRVGLFSAISDDFSATIGPFDGWMDLRTGATTPIPKLSPADMTDGVALTRDGRTYLASSRDPGLPSAIVDGPTGRWSLLPINGSGVSLSANGRFVLVRAACASEDCDVFRYDRATGDLRRVARPELGQTLVSNVADDGRVVVASGKSYGDLTVVEASGFRRRVPGSFPAPGPLPPRVRHSGTLTSDGSMLLLRTSDPFPGHRQLIRMEDGVVLAQVTADENLDPAVPPVSSAISPDGSRYFEVVRNHFDSQQHVSQRIEVYQLDGTTTLRALRANEVRRIQVVGEVGGSPTDAVGATSVALNVTVTDPRADGFLTVWPCGGPRPLAANVNVAAGATAGAAVVSGLDADGDVCVSSNVDANVVIDVAGWFGGASMYHPITPRRLADTRAGDFDGVPVLPAGRVLAVNVAPAVPADARAAMLTVVAVAPPADAFVTVWPCGQPQPLAANLNVRAGETSANAVLATIGTDRSVCVASNVATALVVDAQGWLAGAVGSTIASPRRVLDTRRGEDDATPNLLAGERVEIPQLIAPGNAVLQVAVTNTAAAGFVTVWPCGEPRPLTSNLNFEAGQTVGNLVIAPASDTGVCAAANVPVDLVIDLQGTLGVDSGYVATDPERLLDTRA